MTVTREAAWSADAAAVGGWTTSLVWYAAAIREMKALTPRLDEFRDGRHAVAASKDQPAAAPDQRLRQLGQAVVQPPPGCTPERPGAGGPVVEDEHREDRSARLDRSLQP